MMNMRTHKLAVLLVAFLLAATYIVRTQPASAQPTQAPAVGTNTNLATASAGQAGEIDVPQALSAEVMPCPMTLPEGDVDGETVICGQIEVPEDWDNPEGKSIVISYAVAKAENKAPFADPILYFEGGPGATSLGSIVSLNDYFRHLRRTRDIIYFDQRGTRYSSNLACPAEVAEQEPSGDAEMPANADELLATISDITLDSDPQKILDAYETIGALPAVTNCGAYFQEQGIDLMEYSTSNSVLDTIALMGTLDYPTYNLYGISYGSALTQEVVRFYDEHADLSLPSVRSVLIDGVYPTFADINEHVVAHPFIIMDVLDACEEDVACATSYPNIRQRAIDLLAALEEEPLVLDETTSIGAADLAGVLRLGIGRNDAVPYLPRLIDEMERGETEVYMRLRDGTLPVAPQGSTDLSNPLDAFSQEASNLVDQTRALADQIEALAAQTERLSAAYSSGLPLPEAFAEEFGQSIDGLATHDANTVSIALQEILYAEQNRATLIQLVIKMPEPEQEFLLGLVGLMDDEQVVQTLAILREPEYTERLDFINQITHTIIECSDRYAPFDLVGFFEHMRAFPAPQLIDLSADMANFPSMCEGYGLTYPSDQEPRPPITNATGIPMLLTNGLLDQMSPIKWGIEAFDYLQNAKMLTFAQSFHGASVESECAMDIANAFFMYPEGELNLACMDDLRPVFVMPDDELPEPAES